MSTTERTCKLTFGYADSDQKRQYAFDIASSLRSGVKAGVKAVNQSLAAGTAGGLSSFFVSDEGDNFTMITAAQLITETVEDIAIGGSE